MAGGETLPCVFGGSAALFRDSPQNRLTEICEIVDPKIGKTINQIVVRQKNPC